MKSKKCIYFTLIILSLFVPIATKAQTISPHLISANAWMSEQVYGGNFNRLMTSTIGTATASNKKMDAQLIRIGGWNYENDGKTNNKEFFAEFSEHIINGGGIPLVQLPHWLTDTQTREWLTYILIEKRIEINYFSIGNEPFLHSETSNVGLVANYTKRISNIIREFKPEAIIFGLDEYQLAATTASTFELMGDGPNSIIGTNEKGQYYIDVIAWHDYTAGINNGDLSISFNKITQAVNRVNQINETRPADKQLKWAITEFNTTYKNDIVPAWATTYSFWAGQYFAILANFAIQNNCYSLNPWSVQENGSSKGPLDLSMYNGDDSPRSSAVHWTLLGRTLRSTYVATNSGLSNVTSIASKDDDGYTVMIVGTNSQNQSFDLTVGNGQVSFSSGNGYTIYAYETRVLLFDKNGTLTDEVFYNGDMTEASGYPFVPNAIVVGSCESFIEVSEVETTKLEAENYCQQSGLLTEKTSDVGGGLNVGFLDNGDYMIFPIQTTKNADYIADFRLASLSGGGSMKILIDEKEVANLDIAMTGDWQAWANQEVTLPIDTGKHFLKILVSSGGWNLNFFDLTLDEIITSNHSEITENELSIYPNPVFNELHLSDSREWTLVDLYGTVLYSGNSSTIQVQDLTTGVYFLKTNSTNLKFIKK